MCVSKLKKIIIYTTLIFTAYFILFLTGNLETIWKIFISYISKDQLYFTLCIIMTILYCVILFSYILKWNSFPEASAIQVYTKEDQHCLGIVGGCLREKYYAKYVVKLLHVTNAHRILRNEFSHFHVCSETHFFKI